MGSRTSIRLVGVSEERVRRLSVKGIASRAIRTLPAGRWSDSVISILEFVIRHRRVPRLRNPVLFNDRLLKIKLDGSLLDPLRQFVTDKEYVKYYVAAVVGKEYTLETFDVLRGKSDVECFVIDRAPCVIKPTHMSGPVLLCPHRETPIDRSLLVEWLRGDYYRKSREVNYRFLERKVIVEEFFPGDHGSVPHDYKIFCFHGDPKIIEVDADRFVNHTRNFYDTAWNRLQLTVKYPAGDSADPKPRQLETMLAVAGRLAKPFSSIRIDMYANENAVKIGELTNCHGGGGEQVGPKGAERWLGELFDPGVAGRSRR